MVELKDHWRQEMKGKLQCYSCQTLMEKHVHVFESLQLEGAGVQPQWIQGDSKGRRIGEEKLIYLLI